MTTRAVIGAAFGVALLAFAPAHAEVRLFGEASGAQHVSVVSWRDMPFRTVVRQARDFSCGSAAVATLLTYHYEAPTTESDAFDAMWAVGDQTVIRRAGFSMLDIRRYLRERGYAADGFRLGYDQLVARGRPAIVLVTIDGYKHFVVVKGANAREALVGDPARGLKRMPREQFERIWNGVALMAPEGDARFDRADEWARTAATPISIAPAPGFTGETLRELPPLYQITLQTDLSLPLP
jgi:predicted double-glycine peptidase